MAEIPPTWWKCWSCFRCILVLNMQVL